MSELHAKTKIPSLDGIRGVAIVMVLVNHGAFSFPNWVPEWAALWADGPLGVRIFFVLSGYLMYSLGAAEIAEKGSFDWKSFYVRRALRILPCMFLYLLVIAALEETGFFKMPVSNYFRVLTFSQNITPWLDIDRAASELNVGHFWSLAFEEQFYLFWPIMMLLGIQGRLRSFAVMVIVLTPLTRVISYLMLPADQKWALDRAFPNSFDCIAMGVLLAELSHDPIWRSRLNRLVQIPCVMGVALAFPLLIHRPLAALLGGGYSLLVGKTLELSAIALVIFYAVNYADTWLYKMLNLRVLRGIGIISYGLYVWNGLFFMKDGGAAVILFPLNFVVVFAVAIASYFIFEKPALRLKKILR